MVEERSEEKEEGRGGREKRKRKRKLETLRKGRTRNVALMLRRKFLCCEV